jgi:REP element-mobilizing transposase RayT
MPRKERITHAGFYHIINRGVEKRNIFLDDEDYNQFLEILNNVKNNYNIIIHNYTLMTNHYHILLETTKSNISEAIKQLNASYSIYFNNKYKRSGHLWQGRFLSYYLYDDKHFWEVAKYIERNPIKANLVDDIAKYPYQSYHQWKYKDSHFHILEDSKIFEMKLQEYTDFINHEFEGDVLSTIYTTPKFVMRDGEMKILYRRLETFFADDKDINRNHNIKKAYDYGYSKVDISRYLSLSSKSIATILSDTKNN